MIMKTCLVFLSILIHGVLHLQASHVTINQDLQSILQPSSPNPTYRTAYHFQPPKNWMNDPNGPMIYKGIYHLFYQYNPDGPSFGKIVWAHSTSKDLVNWTPHPPALSPSQPSTDSGSCWSGSATIISGQTPAILYTGLNQQQQQVQALAVPKNLSDPHLLEWIKSSHNPLMAPTSQNQINGSSFRDPSTAWLGHDLKWRMVVGSKRNRRGLAILYKSKDFIHWTKSQHPLHSGKDSGMWECPDFYPVKIDGKDGLDTSTPVGTGIRHVLKISLDETRHDLYSIGRYNARKDSYAPEHEIVDNGRGLRYDYGKFYASKTFYDSVKRRRILWGWINESLPIVDYVKQGWSGLQAIPRSVWLDKSGKQLVQWPIHEIEMLRTNKISMTNKVLKEGSKIKISKITAAQADIEVSFEVMGLEKAEKFDPKWRDAELLCNRKQSWTRGGLGPFGIMALASMNLEEFTAVYFTIFKFGEEHGKYVVLMCSDQTKSSLNVRTDKTNYGAFLDVNPVHDQLSLRSLIDHSIVESFGGGGKVCITSRVYPSLAIKEAAHLYVFNNGASPVRISKMKAWSMKKGVIN
ncbi:beta-fructofuranosidase, insoluble isoenzyme CWINV1-like [Impatiens glandulifera]|uniref:beta-fructofuranosidase, insoluble isoenzyme CWINV1-like n=1 Tax=Impatiens glandulifera TaxID=253017 RepID=UPI001FB0848D|nr:beta-fructofuranosidase, insoluble isoenzyme CWINV1-like [Impatiens glandulifera]